ncbi:MAG: hypothetical protein CMM56_06980 [Rhodospirillaceae bacterium]|nr:hypothetical protein [Rhodospirillaceae bacterium]|tara:strand:+ start:1290 stop:2414 length:1125 start_codon:yes stop_codon:yes gene_type:complete
MKLHWFLKEKIKTSRNLIVFILYILSINVHAHHSRAEFAEGAVREIEGEVIRVVWRNPHVMFNIKTILSDGSEEIWELEAGDAGTLARRGLEDGHINVGDQIKVAGPISTRRDHYMAVSHALLSNGLEMIFGNSAPLWSEQFMGGGRSGILPNNTISLESNGIFRVWIRMGSTPYDVIEQPPLTPEARVAWQSYDPLQDDPVLDCILPGMPRVITMAGSRPIQFEEDGDNILLHSENFNLTRTIHMNMNGPSNSIEASPLGYSRGQWDGNTLIVTTTHISWPLFELPPLYGVPQSEEMEIIERFTLNDDELVYDFWAYDPVNFTQPIEEFDYFVWRWDPQVRIRTNECEVYSRSGINNIIGGNTSPPSEMIDVP